MTSVKNGVIMHTSNPQNRSPPHSMMPTPWAKGGAGMGRGAHKADQESLCRLRLSFDREVEEGCHEAINQMIFK